MEELKMSPRDYQKSIFETCKEKDCLVVLPTGTGKTLIAIMVAIERFKKFPLEKILILAPTRPLIDQHFNSFKENLPENWADMQIFTGKTPAEKRKDIWKTAEFIFSTPQCIANDLNKNLYNLNEVSLLIVDECHRCMKNYAYNKVAQDYKKDSINRRVVGLTASPGGDKTTIKTVCENLGIEAVEIRTRESPDVRPYLQELDFEKIEIKFPSELEEIRILMQGIYDEKLRELKNRKVLFGYSSKTMLLKLQGKLMNELRRGRDLNKMMAISACAQALKISHAMELLETQTISSFIAYLKDLFKQSEEKKSKGVQKLTKDPRFQRAYTLATALKDEHPKIKTLKKIVEKQFEKDKNSRIIVFAQFRETVRKISETLNKLDKVNADNFVGQAIKEHGKGRVTGLKQKEQKEMIEKFKSGKINVLVATSIAEEGLDIPEVNEVIFYEPVPSAIRKIQRAGRTARLTKGSLKILITKNTRDEIYHYAAYHKEKRMHSAIDQIKKGFSKDKRQETLFN
jgi:Fanconi anemia group M protein|tara:strand:- start:3665 stop:5206 length:1542 start_codon:yes stop_codon:yes gene_type:complete